MRDLGNTLIVVEHDEETMLSADHIVDIGPGAGEHGGHVVAQGTPEEIMANPDSITGQFLSGRRCIPVPAQRRQSDRFLRVRGARANNLKGIDVDIPLGVFTCVTGVSGSGKSSLVNEVIKKTLLRELNRAKVRNPGACEALEAWTSWIRSSTSTNPPSAARPGAIPPPIRGCSTDPGGIRHDPGRQAPGL